MHKSHPQFTESSFSKIDKAFVLISLVCVTLALPLTSAVAQSSQITRKVIETHEISETNEELRMILVEFPPGAASTRHVHPVAGLVYIIEGTAESRYEGEPIKTLKAGDSMQDEANKIHLIFRNTSTSKALKFLVFCKITKGQSFLIDSEEKKIKP